MKSERFSKRLGRLFGTREAPRAFNHSGAVDLSSAAFFADPYPTYARLRQCDVAAPVTAGGYIVARHSDVIEALSNADLGNAPSRFSTLHSRHRERRASADMANNILPFLDKPEHIQPRRILSRAVLSGLKDIEAVAADISSRLVSEARGKHRPELLSDFASPFSLSVMCRFIGAPFEDGPMLKSWSQSFFRLFAPITDADILENLDKDMNAFRQYVARLIANPATADANCLAKRLLQPEGGGELPPQQIIDSCILVFADGVENVEAGIANTMLALNDAEDARRAIEQDYTIATAAVTEALRLDSPAQIIPRIARRDTTLAGRDIKADTPVFLALASANRDPDAFDDADLFHVRRDQSRTLTFGRGRHSCIGAPLATLQITAATQALVNAGARAITPRAEIRYAARFAHRWPEAVELGFRRTAFHR